LQVAKKAVTSDLQKFFPEIDTVAFRELFKRSEKKPELAKSPVTVETAEQGPVKETEVEEKPTGKKPRAPAKKKESAAKKPFAAASRKRPKMGSENQR
jgi:hypothetical protein